MVVSKIYRNTTAAIHLYLIKIEIENCCSRAKINLNFIPNSFRLNGNMNKNHFFSFGNEMEINKKKN